MDQIHGKVVSKVQNFKKSIKFLTDHYYNGTNLIVSYINVNIAPSNLYLCNYGCL